MSDPRGCRPLVSLKSTPVSVALYYKTYPTVSVISKAYYVVSQCPLKVQKRVKYFLAFLHKHLTSVKQRFWFMKFQHLAYQLSAKRNTQVFFFEDWCRKHRNILGTDLITYFLEVAFQLKQNCGLWFEDHFFSHCVKSSRKFRVFDTLGLSNVFCAKVMRGLTKLCTQFLWCLVRGSAVSQRLNCSIFADLAYFCTYSNTYIEGENLEGTLSYTLFGCSEILVTKTKDMLNKYYIAPNKDRL